MQRCGRIEKSGCNQRECGLRRPRMGEPRTRPNQNPEFGGCASQWGWPHSRRSSRFVSLLASVMRNLTDVVPSNQQDQVRSGGRFSGHVSWLDDDRFLALQFTPPEKLRTVALIPQPNCRYRCRNAQTPLTSRAANHEEATRAVSPGTGG
ncbi:hypothetical protein BJY00DRAFT_48986 [Aspergillus carlsbadensis]|nr:hypothetical protein BJY00DRAFT_48986 [Aspergillus carlsbadensis]